MPFWFGPSLSLTTVAYALGLTALGALVASVLPGLKITEGNLESRLRQSNTGLQSTEGEPPLVRDHRRTGGPVRAGGADRLHGLHPDAGEAGHRGSLRRKSIRFGQGGDGPGRRARCGAPALRGGVRRTLPGAVRRAEAAAGGRAGCRSRDPRQPLRADVASSERHRGRDRRRAHPSEDRAEGRHRLGRARLLRRARYAGARRPRVQLGRRRFRPGCGHRQPVVRRPRARRPQRRRSPGAVRAPTRTGRRRRDRTVVPDRRRGSRSRDARRGLARRRGHVPPARATAGLPRLRERRRGGATHTCSLRACAPSPSRSIPLCASTRSFHSIGSVAR